MVHIGGTQSGRLLLLNLLGLLFTAFFALSVSTASADDPSKAAQALYREIKCPICQTSLEQSDTTIANQMKDLIKEQLAAGQTPDQIKAYFVDRYGEGILVAPPKSGGALAAWVVPAVVIMGAGGVLAIVLARMGRKTKDPIPESVEPEDAAYRARLDEELRLSAQD
jgi:cytochrome c-type biogenesis protein CcmH